VPEKNVRSDAQSIRLFEKKLSRRHWNIHIGRVRAVSMIDV